MEVKDKFIHHVFFWLADPESEEAFNALKQGLENLTTIQTIQSYQIGRPADTNRDVIETSYSLSWLLVFANKADQESYQVDPIHLKFVEECKHLWSKVIVYDTV